MIRPENISLTLEQIANSSRVKLVNVSPYKIYDQGRPTEQIGGFAYECVCPANRYEKIVVKVPDLPPVISNDQIDETTFVAFEGFGARFYRDRMGRYQLSCRAERAILLQGGTNNDQD